VSDVVVQHVTFSSQELALRLNQQWRFLTVAKGQVAIGGEPIARIDKRGARVALTPIGPREPVRWIAWAIQSICPDSEAFDDESDPPHISDEPMTPEDVEMAGENIVAERLAAIAKEAVPDGGAHETAALVAYLVKEGHLELAGPMATVVREVFPVLRNVDDTIGSKLEDVLLDLDEVDELFAEAEELTKIVLGNEHILGQS
jgi:hypothetical protein